MNTNLRVVIARTVITFTLLILLSNVGLAQILDTVWVRTLGDIGESLARDIEIVEDGIIVIGTKSMIEGHEPLPALWLLKFDFDGNLIWEREIGDDHVQKGSAVAPAPDGGYICCGQSWIEGVPHSYVVKTDSEGIVEWEQVFPTEYKSIARDIEPVPGGGYISTGYAQVQTIPVETLHYNAYLLELGPDGSIIGYQHYGGLQADETWSIEVLDDGYVLGGRTWSFGAGMRDAVLCKMDLEGNVLWYTTHGGEFKDHIYEIQALDDGGFIATGKTESFGFGSLGSGDIWLLRFAPNGDFMWRSVIGTPPTEFGRSVDVYPNGDFVVAGMTHVDGFGNQVFVGRANPDGEFIWTYNFGGQGMDDAWSVRILPDGDVVVGGHTESLGNAPKSLLLFRLTEKDDLNYNELD